MKSLWMYSFMLKAGARTGQHRHRAAEYVLMCLNPLKALIYKTSYYRLFSLRPFPESLFTSANRTTVSTVRPSSPRR